MALEKCPECKSLMSNKAVACLNCGYPIAATSMSQPDAGDRPHAKVRNRWRDLTLLGTFASVLILVVITLVQS